MYLYIISSSLINGVINSLWGKKVSVRIVNKIIIIPSIILSIIGYYEIVICENIVEIVISRWISNDWIDINLSLRIDKISMSIMFTVIIINSCVQIYNEEYISGERNRLNSKLWIFVFFMKILLCGSNLIIILIGWEGKNECLKWIKKIYSVTPAKRRRGAILSASRRSEPKGWDYGAKLRASRKIRPQVYREEKHNEDVISVIMGSMLGDTHLEKRKGGIGTRIKYEQSNKNVEYLMWYYNFFADRGYCKLEKPKLRVRIAKNNKVNYTYRVYSYTFNSLNWIHEMFYKDGKKIVPKNIGEYLTPLALAVWIMDEGSKLGVGLKIATNSFLNEDIKILREILKWKYNLDTTTQLGGKNKGYTIYLNKENKQNLYKIVEPYILPSMVYKFK